MSGDNLTQIICEQMRLNKANLRTKNCIAMQTTIATDRQHRHAIRTVARRMETLGNRLFWRYSCNACFFPVPTWLELTSRNNLRFLTALLPALFLNALAVCVADVFSRCLHKKPARPEIDVYKNKLRVICRFTSSQPWQNPAIPKHNPKIAIEMVANSLASCFIARIFNSFERTALFCTNSKKQFYSLISLFTQNTKHKNNLPFTNCYSLWALAVRTVLPKRPWCSFRKN